RRVRRRLRGPPLDRVPLVRAETGRRQARDRRRLAARDAGRAGPRMTERWPRVASLRTPAALRARLGALGLALPCDDAIETGAAAPVARALPLGGGLVAGNRFAIQPMEGW